MKLAVDFITWRWAPAVGLLTASMIYVIVVVGLVPSEIGVPVANAKFEPKPQATSGGIFGGVPANVEANESTYTTTPAAARETRPALTPPRPVVRAPVADFGRRGFSPPLARPEPPAAPAAPASPTPIPPVTRGGIAGIFSRIQGALRPGSPAAQSLAEAAQARQAQAASSQAAPPAAPSAEPAPAPAENGPQQPPDAPAAPAESAAPAPSGEAPAAPAQ